MLRYPNRKEYKLVIKTSYGNLVIEYKQAFAEETLEFLSLKGANLYQYLSKFFQDNGKCEYVLKKVWYKSNKKYLRKKIFIESKIFNEALKTKGLFLKIKDTLHKSGESLYTGMGKGGDIAIDNITYMNMCSSYSIGPNQLLKEYTMEQITYMSDGLAYMANIHSDEGKIINRKVVNNLINPKEKEKVNKHIKDFRKHMQK